MSATEVVEGSSPLAGLGERELAILRAAYHVMGREGSNRLNLQAIADEAGVSKGLVLYHFGNKNTVLQQAMVWALLQTERRIREAVEALDGDDLVSQVVDAIFVSPAANREFQLVYLDMIEAAAREAAFADLPAMIRDIVEGLYREVIAMGVEHGVLDVEDAGRAAEEMRTVIDGTFVLWLQDADWQASHAPARERCVAMLRTLLGAR